MEVLYETSCRLCDEHKTDLGALQSIWTSVTNGFPDLDTYGKLELTKLFYEQYKLDRRTEFISKAKMDTTNQIHKHKLSEQKARE
jgi:hypothetical protein